uniref:G_PROTEIN_RECEP_F1_2 domain-containing protein n=1 Tax=Steinernema glaseri TaxID=37863 RepID=A0A1I7YVD4_9BILA
MSSQKTEIHSQNVPLFAVEIIFRLLHVLCVAEVQLLLSMVLYAALKLIHPQMLLRLSRPKGIVLVVLSFLPPCVIVALLEGAQELEGAPNCLNLNLNVHTLLLIGLVLLYHVVYLTIAAWAIYIIKEVFSRRNFIPSLETNYFIQILLVAAFIALPPTVLVSLMMFHFTGPPFVIEACMVLVVSYSCISTAASILIFTPYRTHTTRICAVVKSRLQST